MEKEETERDRNTEREHEEQAEPHRAAIGLCTGAVLAAVLPPIVIALL